MATNKGWKALTSKQLKKIVPALNEDKLKQYIKRYEERGWVQASEIKPYREGVGCLMIYDRK